MKIVSKTTAPIAPYHEEIAKSSETATAISIAGNATPTKPTKGDGTPKSATAFREPARSANFAKPARANTAARNSLNIKSASSNVYCQFDRLILSKPNLFAKFVLNLALLRLHFVPLNKPDRGGEKLKLFPKLVFDIA